MATELFCTYHNSFGTVDDLTDFGPSNQLAFNWNGKTQGVPRAYLFRPWDKWSSDLEGVLKHYDLNHLNMDYKNEKYVFLSLEDYDTFYAATFLNVSSPTIRKYLNKVLKRFVRQL